ncbi:MAG: hypothetical protein Q9M40_11400 [Sulfurimonas sp.]|nr:hypothetical protein [Sulfurimonas sp.]
MKITKMSLVAALLIGSSAFAIENTKVTGDANLYYTTSDASNGNLLESGSSVADVAVNLNLTTDVLKTDSVAVSAGLGYTLVTTLGLEGQMVDNVWSGAHDSNTTKDASWMNEAWFAATSAKTTVKIGRMELDTPLAFTETWGAEKNTFDAAVVINQDIPDTTLVGAYIGRGNGNTVDDTDVAAGIVANNGDFSSYGTIGDLNTTGKGAYAVGAVNNSWKPLSVQAWYYDIVAIAQASWLQADLSMDGIIAGGQYTSLSLKDTQATALMVGYEAKDLLTATISYSYVSVNGSAAFNTATVGGYAAQSKLYTEAWWNYGFVTQAGASTIHASVEGDVADVTLAGYYTYVDQPVAQGNGDFTEFTVTASKSYGPVDVTLAYINATVEDNIPATEDNSNTLQVYLTANF